MNWLHGNIVQIERYLLALKVDQFMLIPDSVALAFIDSGQLPKYSTWKLTGLRTDYKLSSFTDLDHLLLLPYTRPRFIYLHFTAIHKEIKKVLAANAYRILGQNNNGKFKRMKLDCREPMYRLVVLVMSMS